jgi:peptidoglycan/xylan/chitin deacetylase (PgdA/CDA1 family)
MKRIINLISATIILLTISFSSLATKGEPTRIPVLVYHKFDPEIAKDSMTVTTAVFESQLKWLLDNGYTVISLRSLVNYLQGKGDAPKPKSVVITIDDGHKSLYTYAVPIILQYNIPITLFIYPTGISDKSTAERNITWKQLRKLQKTRLFDIQSHTQWHPNFRNEKKALPEDAYQKFVRYQLAKSKEILEKKLGYAVDILAWPYGIFDKELETWAQQEGYIAAFTISRKYSSPSYPLIRQPRYLILNSDGTKNFAAIIEGSLDETALDEK